MLAWNSLESPEMLFELDWKRFSTSLCYGIGRETEGRAGLLREWQRHAGSLEAPGGQSRSLTVGTKQPKATFLNGVDITSQRL